MAVHVVFGAGQVGSGLARRLAARGHTVRVVRRSPATMPGIEVVAGDARDPAFVADVTRDTSVMYHCMNPSAYDAKAWESEFPALGRALIGGAVANGAKLVCLDNLYAYGVVDGPRTEDTPLAAPGRKGRVRVEWDAALRAAARDQGLRWAAGRAGDFFGPGTGEQSLFSSKMVAGLAAGRSAWLVGDSAAPHAFGYVPDVIAGLVALGESDAQGVYHLPTVQLPPAELVRRLAVALGSSARAYTVPGWLVSALGTVVPLFRELRETLYQWDRPFLVDDTKFRARFPGIATDVDGAVAACVAEVPRAVAAYSPPARNT